MVRALSTTSLLTLALLCGASTASADNYAFSSYMIPGTALTVINDINDNNQFVGNFAFQNNIVQGFLQSPGAGVVPIDAPNASGPIGTQATGINDSGEIVGYYGLTDGYDYHGFDLKTGVGYTNVGPGGDPQPSKITVDGQIVGSASNSYINDNPAYFSAFIDYRNGSNLFFPEPNAPPNQRVHDRYIYGTFGYGINDYGAVVGSYSSTITGYQVGFSYTNTGFTTITAPGALDTFVTDITNTGLIVGWYDALAPNGHDTQDHGFIDINGVITTVDVPGAYDTVINGVNNNGVIVGGYDLPAPNEYGVTTGFIGTPAFTIPTTGFARGPFGGFPAPAPEPGVWAMMLLGLGVVGGWSRAARRDGSTGLRMAA